MDIAPFLLKLRTGDHVCQFYRSDLDLAEALIPYFKEGLERNQACVWIASDPYRADRALSDMRTAISDLDRRIDRGQLVICDFDQWYVSRAVFDGPEVIRSWVARNEAAEHLGFDGLRITGNTSFVEPAMWADFMAYERALDSALKSRPITTLCSYCVSSCSGDHVMDVMANHRSALVKHENVWAMLEARAVTTPAGIALHWIVEQALARYLKNRASRVQVRGEDIMIGLTDATKLDAIFGELAANAVKFGALARDKGIVTIRWALVSNGSRRLEVIWRESGLDALVLPEQVGHGLFLIATNTEDCTRVFDSDGFMCTFALTLQGG